MPCMADVGVIIGIVRHILPLADVTLVFLGLGAIVVGRLDEGQLPVLLAPGIVFFALRSPRLPPVWCSQDPGAFPS